MKIYKLISQLILILSFMYIPLELIHIICKYFYESDDIEILFKIYGYIIQDKCIYNYNWENLSVPRLLTIKYSYQPTAIFWAIREEITHHKNRPAVVLYDNRQYWFYNDKFHRDNGPAIISPDGFNRWFTHGIELEKEKIITTLFPQLYKKIWSYI